MQKLCWFDSCLAQRLMSLTLAKVLIRKSNNHLIVFCRFEPKIGPVNSND